MRANEKTNENENYPSVWDNIKDALDFRDWGTQALVAERATQLYLEEIQGMNHNIAEQLDFSEPLPPAEKWGLPDSRKGALEPTDLADINVPSEVKAQYHFVKDGDEPSVMDRLLGYQVNKIIDGKQVVDSTGEPVRVYYRGPLTCVRQFNSLPEEGKKAALEKMAGYLSAYDGDSNKNGPQKYLRTGFLYGVCAGVPGFPSLQEFTTKHKDLAKILLTNDATTGNEAEWVPQIHKIYTNAVKGARDALTNTDNIQEENQPNQPVSAPNTAPVSAPNAAPVSTPNAAPVSAPNQNPLSEYLYWCNFGLSAEDQLKLINSQSAENTQVNTGGNTHSDANGNIKDQLRQASTGSSLPREENFPDTRLAEYISSQGRA